MKNVTNLRTFFVFILVSTLPMVIAIAQDVGEECDKGNCDSGLHCVNVRMRSGPAQLCSECTQSELNSLTANVTAKCKWMKKTGGGWYPDKNPMYQDAISSADPDQDRVPVEIYDELLEKTKECGRAREKRDNECWDGGDLGHNDARQGVKEMNTNIGKLKRKDIDDKKVFYGSKSSYESAMRTYLSDCRGLNLSRMEDNLEAVQKQLNKEEKVDCDDLEEWMESCEECFEVAQDLVNSAFGGSSSKTPDEIYRTMGDAEALFELGEELLKNAKKEKLCK
ncbi:MAG: hypothetical protein AAFP76_02425 [Bacteroidota bacterium]